MALARMEHQGAAVVTGLAAGITAVSTTFSVNSAVGWPTGAVGPFVVVVDPGSSTEEKILCASRSGTTCTVNATGLGGRGFDGTIASAHSSGSTNAVCVYAAVEADDNNDHVYTTTRDNHTQYARTDGSRPVTGAQTFNNGITVAAGGATVTGTSKVTGSFEVTAGETIDSGGLTITAGGLTVASGVSAVQAVTATTVTGTGEVKGTDFNATGLTGAVAGTRLVGATSSGAPGSGTFLLGDMVVDQTGAIWVCTTAGTPGTWTEIPPLLAPTKKTIAAVNASTSSGTASELDASLEITTTVGSSGAADVLIVVDCYMTVTGASDVAVYSSVDGGAYTACGAFAFLATSVPATVIGSFHYSSLTAGSHVFAVGWSAAGGGTVKCDASSRAATRTGTYQVVTPR